MTTVTEAHEQWLAGIESLLAAKQARYTELLQQSADEMLNVARARERIGGRGLWRVKPDDNAVLIAEKVRHREMELLRESIHTLIGVIRDSRESRWAAELAAWERFDRD